MTALVMDTDEASLGKPTLWGRRKATKRGVVGCGAERPIGAASDGPCPELDQAAGARKRKDRQLAGLSVSRRRAGRGSCEPPSPSPASYRFIELKNSSLDLVFFILSSMNSIALNSSIGCSSLRRIQILASMSGSISRSSRRVPDWLTLIAG